MVVYNRNKDNNHSKTLNYPERRENRVRMGSQGNQGGRKGKVKGSRRGKGKHGQAWAGEGGAGDGRGSQGKQVSPEGWGKQVRHGEAMRGNQGREWGNPEGKWKLG